MSHGARMTDAERTAIMLDLLHGREHGEQGGELPPSSVLLEEVAPGTGWSAGSRWADALVLGMWKSSGQRLDGYEIKASRADLKRELANLNKHRALARYCDSWTLVIWSESMLLDGIPESWGITVVEHEDGDYVLRDVRRAQALTPEPWPRSFVCSLVRNAHQQSPRARWVARVLDEAKKRAVEDGRRYGRDEVLELLTPLGKAVHGKNWWHAYNPDEARRIITRAVEMLQQPALVAISGDTAHV